MTTTPAYPLTTLFMPPVEWSNRYVLCFMTMTEEIDLTALDCQPLIFLPQVCGMNANGSCALLDCYLQVTVTTYNSRRSVELCTEIVLIYEPGISCYVGMSTMTARIRPIYTFCCPRLVTYVSLRLP